MGIGIVVCCKEDGVAAVPRVLVKDRVNVGKWSGDRSEMLVVVHLVDVGILMVVMVDGDLVSGL